MRKRICGQCDGVGAVFFRIPDSFAGYWNTCSACNGDGFYYLESKDLEEPQTAPAKDEKVEIVDGRIDITVRNVPPSIKIKLINAILDVLENEVQ